MSEFTDGFTKGLGTSGLNMEGLGQSLGSNIGGIATAAGGMIGGLIGNGYQSTAGDILNAVGDIGGMIPGPWGAAIGAGAKVLGGLTNAAFGTKVNQEKLNAANQGTEYLSNFNSAASSFDDIQGPLAQSGVDNPYEGGWFNSSAGRKNADLKRKRAWAEEAAYRSVDNNIENIAQAQYDNMLANYRALGGTLGTNGADFTNGMVYINNGGSHERNPYEGVPMGTDQNGTPNLVEEGETVYNDYVFSKRLSVPKAIRKKYKLRGTKISFAEASKKLAKESEERPNDPISKRGLEAAMADLAMEQEKLRAKKPQQQANKFDEGGFTDPISTFRSNLDWIKSLSQPETSPIPTVEYISTDAPINYRHRNEGLRYAPAVGLGLATLTDAVGLTNKPNYSNAKAIIDAGRAVMTPQQVKWNPLGDYMAYNPFDRNYYSNQLAASSGATRRNILNTSGGNRGQALAGLIAADYNAGLQLGNLARQAEEYNLAQRHQVKAFNRATNQANSEGFLKAAMANQDADMKARGLGLEAQMKGYQMREAARLASDEAKAANLSGFIESLGAIGADNAALNARDFALASGTFGPIKPELLYLLTGRRPRSHGGRLNKRRKGLTC